jgi:hypothetical protein
VLLVLVVVARRPCADSVSRFVTSFGDEGSASPRLLRPGEVAPPSGRGSAGDYEQLRPDMTEAELEAAIERSRARARERAGGGAGSGGAGSGSAP